MYMNAIQVYVTVDSQTGKQVMEICSLVQKLHLVCFLSDAFNKQ